uniref:Uncharacterized protein n=1 Tax=Octopus bimaculoides TaxID=37653 RepID=A0A0L8FMD2_OCTBM
MRVQFAKKLLTIYSKRTRIIFFFIPNDNESVNIFNFLTFVNKNIRANNIKEFLVEFYFTHSI